MGSRHGSRYYGEFGMLKLEMVKAMDKNYWTEMLIRACDADRRQMNPLPAEMITVGYAEALRHDGILEEGDEDE